MSVERREERDFAIGRCPRCGQARGTHFQSAEEREPHEGEEEYFWDVVSMGGVPRGGEPRPRGR